MKFKNINEVLDYFENKWYWIQYRTWWLIDEYCIYNDNDYICILWKWKKDFLGCNYLWFDIKRYKKLPLKLDDYFFWKSYEKFCDDMNY